MDKNKMTCPAVALGRELKYWTDLWFVADEARGRTPPSDRNSTKYSRGEAAIYRRLEILEQRLCIEKAVSLEGVLSQAIMVVHLAGRAKDSDDGGETCRQIYELGQQMILTLEDLTGVRRDEFGGKYYSEPEYSEPRYIEAVKEWALRNGENAAKRAVAVVEASK